MHVIFEIIKFIFEKPYSNSILVQGICLFKSPRSKELQDVFCSDKYINYHLFSPMTRYHGALQNDLFSNILLYDQ